MAAPLYASESIRGTTPVLVVGPPRDALGGMASVVAQHCDMDFAGRFRVVALPAASGSGPSEPLARRCRRHFAQLSGLRTALRSAHAPLVHIHTCSGFSFYRSTLDLVYSRLHGARVILHVHGGRFETFYAAQSAWGKWWIRKSLDWADAVVALSANWRKRILRIAPNANVMVMENGVEIPTPAPQRRPGGRCHFLFLGQMDKEKGVQDLLEAAVRLRDAGLRVRLTLAGPPGNIGNAKMLRDRIVALELAELVNYVGPVVGRDKSDLFRRADVFVLPSWDEGMPIALLEALAYGLPVVASNVGAIPEVLMDESAGLLVPPKRPERLADAMAHLAGLEATRAAMSSAARNLAQRRFTAHRLRDDLLGLYDTVLQASRGKTSMVAPGYWSHHCPAVDSV